MSDQFHPVFDHPDPDAVARTERVIDALAKREPVDIGDRALAGLLEDWRDELRAPASRAPPCPAAPSGRPDTPRGPLLSPEPSRAPLRRDRPPWRRRC